MALWGISTGAETAANNYAIPKHLGKYSAINSQFEATDRNKTPYNCFADTRGWVYRNYKEKHPCGITTRYWDSLLVQVSGMETAGISSTTVGLGSATPIAVFFEDPNLASPITISAGGTTGIGTGTTGYVHVVWNETVWCSAGATIAIVGVNTLGVTTASVVATAASAGYPVKTYVSGVGYTFVTFNGQVTNRVAFAFTAPSSGIGTVLRINVGANVVGTVTDFYSGNAVIKTLSGLIKNIAGAGTTSGVGIGTTTLTIKA